MYDVMCKEIVVKKGMFVKERVLKYYLEGQDIYFDRYEYFLDHKIVMMYNTDCDDSEYFYFSTVTGKLIHQGLLYTKYLCHLEYYGFVVLSHNGEVFKFSVENNEFVKVAENIKNICVCENIDEKSLCFLNNIGEIEIFGFYSCVLLNTIRLSLEIFSISSDSGDDSNFSLKVNGTKKFYIISEFKDFSSYTIVYAVCMHSVETINHKKYYIANGNKLLDHNFCKLYPEADSNNVSLSFYEATYVIITKKNISGPDTYGLFDLRDGKVILRPIYNAIIEDGNELIGRIYGEDLVIKN